MNDRSPRTNGEAARGAADTLRALRQHKPLVQNVTNFVAMDISANLLLAVGASPAMVHAESEVAEFLRLADALVINVGTLSTDWVDAMGRAAGEAELLGVPWVLDPVGAGATAYRSRVLDRLLRLKPTVVRGNASEILALAGSSGSKTRGVDSTASAESALDAAKKLARNRRGTVAVTGAIDYVTDGERLLAIDHGHPMMTRVTGLGCALSALVAATLSVVEDPLWASAHALAILGIAGERAADGAAGPGSFRVRLLDCLYALDETALANPRISELAVA